MRRTEWGPGPWSDEPDEDYWVSESGLPCVVVRGPVGAWCGYVGRPHLFMRSDDPADRLEVHGGVTFVKDYVPDGETDVWELRLASVMFKAFGTYPPRKAMLWIGFDCSHGGDLLPASIDPYPHGSRNVYRDLAYVRAECERLAEQVAKLPTAVNRRVRRTR